MWTSLVDCQMRYNDFGPTTLRSRTLTALWRCGLNRSKRRANCSSGSDLKISENRVGHMALAEKVLKPRQNNQMPELIDTVQEDCLMTAENVARIIGLSVETLAQWRSQRKGIPFVQLSRNVVRYRQADLDSWLKQRTVPVRQD